MNTLTVPIADVKKRLSDYLDRAVDCRVVITRRNRPVAAIVGMEDLRSLERKDARKGLLSLLGRWEGFDELEGDIRNALESRHSEEAGRDVPL